MTVRHLILATAFLLATLLAWAQTPAAAEGLPPLLPREKEIALAESAGLSTQTKEADLYVLARGGYVKVRQGTNGFSCFVGRSRPDTLEPMCFDPEGTETILPRYLE